MFGYLLNLNFCLKSLALHIPLIPSHRRWIKSYYNFTFKKVLSTLKFWTIANVLQQEFQ